ncbi:MAG: cob(I)yrinic acid a,c-diamide adenosyltransferase, partial [Bacteroidales bacterium]
LTSGNILSCQCHITRTVCRRAERDLINLQLSEPEYTHTFVQIYLNRLSDYLFLLALTFCKPEEIEFNDD